MTEDARLNMGDWSYVEAAEGWLELGNLREANEELVKIASDLRSHPRVLGLRWKMHALVHEWDACVEIAREMVQARPGESEGWLNLATSVQRLGRGQEAKDILLSVVKAFELDAAIPFDLARYCGGLGQVREAKQWLGKALLAAKDTEEVQRLRKLALEDPALEPLRTPTLTLAK